MIVAAIWLATALLDQRRIHVRFPELGDVVIDLRVTEDDAHIVARQGGRVVFRERFAGGRDFVDGRHARAASYRLRGLRTPVVLAEIDGPAADGVWTMTRILGEVDGRVVPLIETKVDRSEEGICIEPDRIVAGTLEVGEEAFLSPHRYRFTTWIVRQDALVRSRSFVTKRRYGSFANAQRELDRRCTDRLEQLMLR